MKRDPAFYVISGVVLGVLLYLWVTLSSAQEITKVPPPTDNAAIIFLVVGAGIAAGALFLRVKQPALWAKITLNAKAAGALAEQARAGAEHFVSMGTPYVAEAIAKGKASLAFTGLHQFEAHLAPAQAPAIALTPTSQVVQIAASMARVAEKAQTRLNTEMHEVISGPMTHEQFMSDDPVPPVEPAQDQAAPKFVDGRMV